jgi:peptidoglycan/xylan/chitin deacetylase (PgdA/CDA1 family)
VSSTLNIKDATTTTFSLIYHDVIEPGAEDRSGFPGADAAVYKLTVKDFEAHLAEISNRIVPRPHTAADLLRASAPKSPVLFHFDDGGVSGYELIADRLEHWGWRGHFHITTDYIGHDGFMTAEQILNLHQRGHLIGSHSASHPERISTLSQHELEREWRQSIDRLSEVLGEPCRFAAIPGGFNSSRVVKAAAKVGVKLVFDSEPWARRRINQDCLVYGRYNIQRNTPAHVAADLATGKAAPRFRQWAFWNTKKVVKRVGGKYWLKARKSILSWRK